VESLQAGDPLYVGGYRLTGRLGAGGMGRVYLGVSPGGRQVAVKLMHAEHCGDWEFRQRFAREVAAARRVGGFHTAPVVDADPEAEPPWMVTAYIPGPSLDQVVRSAGPLAPSALRALAAGLAEGLLAVHAAGLVHRDLKPGNVIMAQDGPRIIDFGIARATDAAPLTSSGVLVGTFSFMSPEQVRGDRIGPESDVFSLGGVLAYGATGHGPFDAATVPAIIHRIVTQPPDLGSLSGPLGDVVRACLAKDPADRPALGHLLGFLSDGTGQLAPGPRPAAPASSPIAPPAGPLPAGPSAQRAGGHRGRKPGRLAARRVALGGALAAVLATAVALGIVLGTHDTAPGSHAGPTGAPPSGSGQPATAAPATWFTVCTEPADSCRSDNVQALRTEPSEIINSVDGSGYIKDIAWSGWGTATAKGTGTLELDNCEPNCGQGHDTAYAATVTLTQLAPYGNGEQAYSVMAISVPAAPSASRTFNIGLVP